MAEMTPRQIVKELDRYIIGQNEAKKTVAIALRNRYRRSMVSPELRDEISPKNIIMEGPTGCGKTEIARRLAKLVNAPFIKVEATKYTEVGYVGRDVESMIRDLAENAVRMVTAEQREKVMPRAQVLADERILDILAHPEKKKATNPLDYLLGRQKENDTPDTELVRVNEKKDELRKKLLSHELDKIEIEAEVADEMPTLELGGSSVSLGDMMGNMLPQRTKTRRMNVADARRILAQEEADKLIDKDAISDEAIRRTEQHGIVFIDEIDKIAGSGSGHNGPEVSREGVQRDILPIVEGCTVTTKYGPVNTDYILFIAAGAFHVAKITDLIPELQGRFPVHVRLNSLTKEDFEAIMTAPDNALIKQYKALLAVDHVLLDFDGSAVTAIAEAAFSENETNENIGARRLYGIFEQLLEDISFNAGEDMPDYSLLIDAEYVNAHLRGIHTDKDLRKYIV